jgi:hypothetical protein
MTSNAVKLRHGLQHNKLEKIWKSKLDRTIKIKFFRACVESILMYGSETWTVTKALEERINGCYTQLLRRVMDISWWDHQTNKKVYSDIPPVSLNQKAAATVCGPLLAHIRPANFQLYIVDSK